MTPTDEPLSPNHSGRRDHRITLAVLHYTGMRTGSEALTRLCDPEAGVSAHYLVEEDGEVFHLVDETRCAWHAGVAAWLDNQAVNAMSIGIEIVNPGHEWGYRSFPRIQIDSVVTLLRGVMERHAIRPEHVVGHSDVAPNRKDDPGELFPWSRLAQEGLAIGPWSPEPAYDPPSGEEALRLLESIGYGVKHFGASSALLAFQRRFVPSELGQSLNAATRAAISEVAARFEAARRA